MGILKNYYEEHLSSEEFDLLFDDEYELWLQNKNYNESQYYWDLIKKLNENTNGTD